MTSKKNAIKPVILSRKENFYRSLVPFVGEYGKDMVRAFFDYWSKLNNSCTKMRFEQQPAWDVAERLATWASITQRESLSPAERKKFENYIRKNLASVFN